MNNPRKSWNILSKHKISNHIQELKKKPETWRFPQIRFNSTSHNSYLCLSLRIIILEKALTNSRKRMSE